MESKSRICCVCKLSYKYCPSCREDKDKEPWHFSFCSENCKNIYVVTSRFENGQIDVDIAESQLARLDISKLDNFGTSYKNTIGRIISSESVSAYNTQSVKDKTEGINDMDTQIDTIRNDEVDEEKSIKKSSTRRTKMLNSNFRKF